MSDLPPGGDGSQFRVARAARTTIYVERYGARYVLVKGWAAGARMAPGEANALVVRALRTEPDERLIIEHVDEVPRDHLGLLLLERGDTGWKVVEVWPESSRPRIDQMHLEPGKRELFDIALFIPRRKRSDTEVRLVTRDHKLRAQAMHSLGHILRGESPQPVDE